jgi:uncharacterized protein (TIGR03067 family)
LTVSKSGKTIRVAAGQYQVEIDGNIDGIAVSDGAVTLKRGGEETVKIVRSEGNGLAARDLQLDGTWEIRHVSQDQQQLPNVEVVRWRFDAKAGTVTTESRDESLRMFDREARVTLNPNSSPKQLTLWGTKPTPVMEAIYEIEGDTLRIAAFSAPKSKRPKSFTSIGAAPLMVLTWKKIAVGISIHLADFEPASELTEYAVLGSGQKVYVAKQPFATSKDIAAARVIDDANGNPAIEITFRSDAGKHIGEVTQQHLNKPVAFLVDGVLLSAPTIRERFGGAAVITGQFSREEAERIASGIRPVEADNRSETRRATPGHVQSSVSVPVEVYTHCGIPLGDLAGPIVPWGEEIRGLSASLRVVPDEMKMELWVRNSSNKPVKFRQCPRADVGLVITVTDRNGQTHDASVALRADPLVFQRLFLPPGHAVKVKEFDVQYEMNRGEAVETAVQIARVPLTAYSPFKIRATWSDTLRTPAGEGDWTGELTTGQISNGAAELDAKRNDAATEGASHGVAPSDDRLAGWTFELIEPPRGL